MTKTLKRILIFILVLQITLMSCSCGKKETPDVDFINPFASYTYDDFESESTDVEKKTEYTTDSDNTFKINSAKVKKSIFSIPSVIISVFTIIVSFIVGGIYTIPGWRSAPSDHKTVVVQVTYKNNLSDDVMLGDVSHVVFADVDGERYDGFSFYQTMRGLDYSPTTVIKAGKSKKLSFAIDVPKDKIKDAESFVIYFDIDGEAYSYQYSN